MAAGVRDKLSELTAVVWLVEAGENEGRDRMKGETITEIKMPNSESPQTTYRAGKQFYDQKQYARAYEAFSEAAALDYPAALRKLGYMYRYGLLVPRDVIRAREFWERAVAKGDGYATGFLGQLLLHGTSRR